MRAVKLGLMKIGSPQEPDLEIDEVSAWSGSFLRMRSTRRGKVRVAGKRKRAGHSNGKAN